VRLQVLALMRLEQVRHRQRLNRESTCITTKCDLNLGGVYHDTISCFFWFTRD
jgi:hypothetical protein